MVNSAINCNHGVPINLQCGACDHSQSPAPVMRNSIDDTLAERGSRYGSFASHAEITQSIKRTMALSPNWERLAPDQAEALEMVAHKIGRILNGDPNYHDSWHDIIGYTKLVADRLEGDLARAEGGAS